MISGSVDLDKRKRDEEPRDEIYLIGEVGFSSSPHLQVHLGTSVPLHLTRRHSLY